MDSGKDRGPVGDGLGGTPNRRVHGDCTCERKARRLRTGVFWLLIILALLSTSEALYLGDCSARAGQFVIGGFVFALAAMVWAIFARVRI